MNRFDYERATDVAQAVSLADKAMLDAAESVGQARFLAGGTNLVDLMKEDVEWPHTLIDVNHLPLRAIEELADGGLRLGALATNSETADHPVVRARYPVLSSAILSGATRQLRNAATNGGNLNQRTRCCYFYDTATPCNKRTPGAGCGALGGFTRMHAILGASEDCVATNPSDMAVALAVLDAQVRVSGPKGERTIPLADYHRLPEGQPWRDNNLGAAELVTAVDLPAGDFSSHYTYLKLRDRLSYAFALVSVAVVLARDDAGRCTDVRIALGGVAHKPWRVPEAEALLRGGAPERALFDQVAARMLEGAVGLGDNDFKIELARRAIVRALGQAASGRPQSQTDKRIA
jgi:xanthine dehydrogenase YagS FAD-binding subunit